MKTIFSAIAFCLLFSNTISSQVTYDDNDPGANFPLGFLGWNDNTNETLTIRQNNWPRMRIWGENWAGYNSVTGVNNSLRVWLPSDNTEIMNNVFSIIHMGEGINPGFERQWMNVGTTYGAGGDFMYHGMLQDPDGSGSQSGGDAVIAWGDNDDYLPTQGPDNLRFLFISSSSTSAPGSSEDQGRETVRITPMGNVGIGDFSTMPQGIAAAYGQPRARLDVQFRNEIPDNTDNTAINVFNDVFENIGQNPINFKRGIYSVVANSQGENINWAIAGDFLGTGGKYPVGVNGEARGITGSTVFGVRGVSISPDQGDIHYGVYGLARFAEENIGLYGQGYQFQSGNFTAGVHGKAGGGGALSNDWGGYFDGDVFTTGGYFPSDATLKENIAPIENATELLSQLSPSTYEYSQSINQLNLPTGNNYGLLAQDLESVLPDLVISINTPSQFDEDGSEIEHLEFKAIRYNDLIAILIAGFNEQSTQVAEQAQIISDQEETIEELENQLADLSESLGQLLESVAQLHAVVEQNQAKSNDCCEKISNLMGDAEKLGKQSSLEQNVPNPFQDVTQIDYNLATNGTVRLIITNELGQPIETLVNGEMSSGQHSVRWNASNRAPGVYYYTLYFNGDLITKKMIKL